MRCVSCHCRHAFPTAERTGDLDVNDVGRSSVGQQEPSIVVKAATGASGQNGFMLPSQGKSPINHHKHLFECSVGPCCSERSCQSVLCRLLFCRYHCKLAARANRHFVIPGDAMSESKQFEMLHQHIDELTREKFELARGLQKQQQMSSSLAEENQRLLDDYNDQVG